MHSANQMNASFPLPGAKAQSRTMHAIVHKRYGTPDVLRYEEVERPLPGVDDVLLRAYAACATIGDHHVVTGKPYPIRLSPFGGLPGPKNPVPGQAVAGVVESVGANVTAFRPGEEVFGEAMRGAFAEYVVVPANRLAAKPSNFSFEEAAALPWATTALQGLRNAGGIAPGQRVLINGASGGVGTWAVQIAKALGAEVTAVCSTRNVTLMRALGADEVIDYTAQDFVQDGARFDLMLDLVGNRSLSDCRRVLHKRGTYVACAGDGGDWFGPIGRLAALLFMSPFVSQTLKTFIVSPNQKDLMFLSELVAAGKAKPIIEQRYPLSEVAEALRRVGEGHAQGQTVIRIAR